MGDLLREIVAQHGTEQDFIGHIGHVNFTICTHTPDYSSLVAELQSQFNKRILIDTNDENTTMSLAIGIVDMRVSLPKGFPEMIELALRLRDGMGKDKPDDIATAW